jgi:hypothetical protein
MSVQQRLEAELASLGEAEEQVRQAAGWVVAVFAAIAGLLLTGIQLTALANADGPEEVLALGAVAMTILGALVVIVAHVSVLVAKPGNLRSVVRRSKEWWARLPGNTDRALTRAYEHEMAPTVASQLALPAEGDAPTRTLDGFIGYFDSRFPPANTSQLSQIERDRLNLTMQRVRAFLSLAAVRHRFRVARLWLIVGAILSVAGIVVFAQATADDEVTADPPAAEAGEARPVVIEPLDEGRAAIAAVVGDTCAAEDLPAYLLSNTGSTAEVVTVPREGCPATRFEMDLGHAVIRDACSVAVPEHTTHGGVNTSAASTGNVSRPGDVAEIDWVTCP